MSKVSGIREARRAARALPGHLREEVAEALKETAAKVHARGLANIAAMTTARSGALRRFYRKRVLKKSLRARVGYVTAAARRRVFYARFVHDGTVKMAARPFHTNAVEAEREADQQRMARARDKAIRAYAR